MSATIPQQSTTAGVVGMTVEQLLTNERKRILMILTVGGIQISDSLRAAILSGMTPAAFAASQADERAIARISSAHAQAIGRG